MKKILLASCSLAVLTYAGTASADDVYKEYKTGDVIPASDVGHQTSATRISFVKDGSAVGPTLALAEDTVLGEYVTLHDKTTLTGGKKLTVNGYLTQTATGSDLSAIDLEINKASVYNSSNALVNEGELVLGNDLKVGNVNMTDGTGVYLFTGSEEHTLTVANGKTLTFAKDNYVKGAAGSSLVVDGNGAVAVDGLLTLDKATTIGAAGGLTVGKSATDTGRILGDADLTILSDATVNHGYIETKNLTIGNGTDAVTVNVSDADGKGWFIGANGAADADFTVNIADKATVNLSDKGHIVVGYKGSSASTTPAINVDGTVNMANGALRAASKTDNKTFASTLNINGTGKVNANSGNNYLISRNTNIATDGELNVASGATLDLFGAVERDGTKLDYANTLNATYEGTLANSGTITIAEGATLNTNAVTIDNAGGLISLSGKIKGNIDAGNGKGLDFKTASAKIDGDASGNLYFKANHKLSEAITGTIAAAELMVDEGGQLVIDDAATIFSIGKIVVGDSGIPLNEKISLGQDITVTGKTKVNDTGVLDLASKTLTTADATGVQLQSGSVLQFNIAEDLATGGKVAGVVTAPMGDVANAKLRPILALNSVDGDYTYADSLAGDKLVVDETNALYNIAFKTDPAVAKNVLTITKKSAGDVGAKIGGNSNDTKALLAVVGTGPTGNTAFDTIQSNLNTLAQTNPGAVSKETKDLNPDESPAGSAVASGVATSSMGVVASNRFSGGLAAGGNSGKNSGDPKAKNGAWAQGMYNKTEFKKGVGFDAKTNGFALGYDRKFGDVLVGVSYAYASTDINARTTTRKTDVETNTGMLYAEYKPAEWFVNGVLSYGVGNNKEKKVVAGVPVSGKYDVTTFGAQVMGGYDVTDWFTPEVGFRYFNVHQQAYTDTAGTRADADDSNIFTGVLAARASKKFKASDNFNLIPTVKLGVTYDFAEASSAATVGLANGTSYTVSGDKLDRFGFEVGAGVKLDAGSFELSARYEGKFRSDYTDNTGLLEARYEF